ncbi:MAG: bifunctional 4-hydroxy-3-methylbut-2-enyl diphosphate reductase/30S ribosomal protein S1 [Bacillota bacterium]
MNWQEFKDFSRKINNVLENTTKYIKKNRSVNLDVEIILAREAGYCFGVKRAINLAVQNASNNTFSLGQMIHNPQVISMLDKLGVKVADEVDNIPDESTVIIRSHGVGPSDIEKANKKKLKVVDGTCPFVQRAQKIAQDLAKKKYEIVIVGDENHPEVKGIKSWANNAHIVENTEQAMALPDMKNVGILAQTTLPEKVFYNVVKVIKAKSKNTEVHNTICRATSLRQRAAKELAPLVDMMVVIGGRNSANTNKLTELCQDLGTPTYHVETAQELSPEMFYGIRKVGITAGASTPDWIIEEVVMKMTEFNEEKVSEVSQDEQSVQKGIEDVSGNALGQQEEHDIHDMNNAPSKPDDVEHPSAVPEEASTDKSREEDTPATGSELSDNGVISLKKGDIITSTIVQITDNEIIVGVGGKSEGIIPKGEISFNEDEALHDLKPGDQIEVYVIKPENEDGHPILSKKRADRRRAWEHLQNAFKNNIVINGRVVEVVKGGLLVDVGIRGFVPASLVERGYVEKLEEYIGKELRLKVIELDKGKNKVVLSQKIVLDEEYEKQKQQTWDSLEEAQVRHGVVRRITDFGAFVDIGGVDGLLHVSEISWGRVDHPRDILQEGQEIDVMILGIDRNNEKVSLGLKQLKENPWKNAAKNYPVGSVVKGKVLRIAPFGAFVEVEPGVEGLVHISQMSTDHVEKAEDVVSIGEIIEAKVLNVDTGAQRMSLSIKEAKQQKPITSKKKQEKREEVTAANESGVTLGDLYGDLLKRHEH